MTGLRQLAPSVRSCLVNLEARLLDPDHGPSQRLLGVLFVKLVERVLGESGSYPVVAIRYDACRLLQIHLEELRLEEPTAHTRNQDATQAHVAGRAHSINVHPPACFPEDRGYRRQSCGWADRHKSYQLLWTYVLLWGAEQSHPEPLLALKRLAHVAHAWPSAPPDHPSDVMCLSHRERGLRRGD